MCSDRKCRRTCVIIIGRSSGSTATYRSLTPRQYIHQALSKLHQLHRDPTFDEEIVVTELLFPTPTQISFEDIAFIGSLSRLRKLTITNFWEERPDREGSKAFADILAHLPELRYLKTGMPLCCVSLSKLTVKCEEIILHNMIMKFEDLFTVERPSLHKLVMAGCFTKFGDLAMVVKSAPNLRYLDLSKSRLALNYKALTQLKYLKELYLNNCSTEEVDLIELAKSESSFAQNLIKLQLVGELMAANKLQMITSFVNLRSLALCCQSNVDTNLIYDIVRNCDKLEELYLCLTKIDNRALWHIGRRLPKIRIIDVRGCSSVNTDGVVEFITERKGQKELVTIRAGANEVHRELIKKPQWLKIEYATMVRSNRTFYPEVDLDMNEWGDRETGWVSIFLIIFFY